MTSHVAPEAHPMRQLTADEGSVYSETTGRTAPNTGMLIDHESPSPSRAPSRSASHLSPQHAGESEAKNIANKYRESSASTIVGGNDPETYAYGDSNAKRFTYIDEDSNYYDDNQPKPSNEMSDASLVKNAGVAGQSSTEFVGYSDPYAQDRSKPTGGKAPWFQYLSDGRYPIEQRIEDKKRGIGRQRHPFVVWILSIIMISVFIYELVVNARAQGTPVSFKPAVNPMLGPSGSAIIYLGARFPPCMKDVDAVPTTTQFACLNDTANPADQLCSLEDICGFGGFHNEEPNQWFRFIIPVFLHAGFIHIGLNLLAQLTVSAQIEREMGSGGFFILYMASGIFGNVLGGNFALVGLPSTGASGAIMGTVSVSFVDLFAHWKYHFRPGRRLAFMIVELIITVGLGYIPYVDNFAHLGGLLMGFLVGMTFYPIISTTKRHKAIVWALRIAAIPIVIILFVTLVRNFYKSDPYAACSGCRYLSCFPASYNDYCKGTGLSSSNSTSSSL